MILLGISGKQRVGKDTVASYLTLRYGFVRLANADYLKKISKKVGWNGQKDEKGRKLLQHLGVIVRDYDPNFWVNYVMKQMKKLEKQGEQKFVITDVRFKNEAEAIKAQEGMLVRVVRDTGIEDGHVSEVELDEYKFDATIDNNGDYDELFQKVDKLF